MGGGAARWAAYIVRLTLFSLLRLPKTTTKTTDTFKRERKKIITHPYGVNCLLLTSISTKQALNMTNYRSTKDSSDSTTASTRDCDSAKGAGESKEVNKKATIKLITPRPRLSGNTEDGIMKA